MKMGISEWVTILTGVTLAVGLIGGHVTWMFKVERHLLVVAKAFDINDKDSVVVRQKRHSDQIEQVHKDVQSLREEVIDLSALMSIINYEPALLAEMAAITKSITTLAERRLLQNKKENDGT